ncbi:MAG: lyase [Coriobacteriia bacterium]|nr:lyase [Coriobacteriia bacterium]
MPELGSAEARTSEELLVAHRVERQDEESQWESLTALQKRGGQTEFDLGRRLTQSDDPSDREIGANLLGQLGSGTPTFLTESVDILLTMLGDPDLDVLGAAIINLGHRGDVRCVAALCEFTNHESSEIRYAVASALGGFGDELAVAALIQLAQDTDFDTRNWAVFGLGSLTEADSDEIRETLASALDDPDLEIRGEALVGLARRGDLRVRAALLREWEGSDVSLLSLEAAEELGDSALLQRLEELLTTLDFDEGGSFESQLLAAIAASSQVMRGPSNKRFELTRR